MLAVGRLRDRPTYGATFLGRQDDSSDSSSGTASTPEFVHESQSQGRSEQTNHQSMPPPHRLPLYVPPPQPQPHPHDAASAPEATPAPAAALRGIHPDLMVPPDAPYARFTVEDLL